MDFDEESSRLSHGSNFVGAIFMCNRTTKKECLKRKLFGLPMSQAGFVNKVKTGMFLFLFEYERRQLYGVFEATTDGAINIAPEAYSKSGSSFPAQVHFESLWICHPLSENEFRDAIRENYFAPYKFNFGLSYIQVAKLVELFSSKKKSPMNHDVSVDTTESPSFPFRVLGASKPNFAQTRSETEALHIGTHPYPSYPDPETYSFSELVGEVPNPTRSRSYDDYLPLEKERYLNFNYDPATFKEVDSARGMRYWKLMPSNPSFAVVEENVYGTEEEGYLSKDGRTCLRTSVFSRLSKAAAPKRISAGEGDGSSPSDLLKMLYRRRSQWSKKRPCTRRNDEDVDSMDPVDAELAGESGGVDEGIVEIPFIDFKRRSGEKNAGDKAEGMVKRRKLIRPSFAESQVKEGGVFKSGMLLDLNSEATHLESNPNISIETGTGLLDLNCEATLLESNASVVNIDSAAVEDDRACKSNQSRAIINNNSGLPAYEGETSTVRN